MHRFVVHWYFHISLSAWVPGLQYPLWPGVGSKNVPWGGLSANIPVNQNNHFIYNIKKASKIHCVALKLYTGLPICITGASKPGVGGGAGAPSLDPLVSLFILTTKIVMSFSLPKNQQTM